MEKRYGHSHKEKQNSSYCKKISKVCYFADYFTVFTRDPLAFCPPVSFIGLYFPPPRERKFIYYTQGYSHIVFQRAYLARFVFVPLTIVMEIAFKAQFELNVAKLFAEDNWNENQDY